VRGLEAVRDGVRFAGTVKDAVRGAEVQ